MPEVIDKPSEVIISDYQTKPVPLWILLLLKDEISFAEDIRNALIQILPGFNEEKVEHVLRELTVRKVSILYRGPREIAEHYEELLKAKQLKVRIESEV
jgi:hypothetical protein